MSNSVATLKRIIGRTIKEWLEHKAFLLSAAASYYAVFSMPGLLMVVMAVGALAFDRQVVEESILSNVRTVLGADAAGAVHEIIANTQAQDRDVWSMALGIATLLSGAMGLFIHLQGALNEMWAVEVRKTARWKDFLKSRLTALGLMIVIGFLLLISMVLTAFLTMLSEKLMSYLPAYMLFLFHAVNFALSLSIISFLFALMFKVLPDVRLRWRYALSGGLASALLFMAGEYCLTTYFAVARPESAFGTAGSIVLFMLWVFYSCLIFFFGASFTRIHAREAHQVVQADKIARKERKSDGKWQP